MINKIINSKNPIILDFDYTLFDTTKFKEETIKNLMLLGVTRDIYYQAYQQIRSSHNDEYIPLEHLKMINQMTNVSLDELSKKYFEALNNCSECLYNDVTSFLDKLTKQKTPLYLLTFGNPTFQKQKVEASGIAHYFKKTIYTNKDKYSVADKIPNANHATFINDNPHEIQSLQTLFPQAEFIQIVRENGKKFDLELENILTVKNIITLFEL